MLDDKINDMEVKEMQASRRGRAKDCRAKFLGHPTNRMIFNNLPFDSTDQLIF